MKKQNTVRYKRGRAKSKSLTQEHIDQHKRLGPLTDDDIDYSDDPPADGTAKWYRPGLMVGTGGKRQITLRLDKEVLDFFKKTGERYQSRINAVLREYVRAHS
jgi:uncharacterized protein (DUF4415 family)